MRWYRAAGAGTDWGVCPLPGGVSWRLELLGTVMGTSTD